MVVCILLAWEMKASWELSWQTRSLMFNYCTQLTVWPNSTRTNAAICTKSRRLASQIVLSMWLAEENSQLSWTQATSSTLSAEILSKRYLLLPYIRAQHSHLWEVHLLNRISLIKVLCKRHPSPHQRYTLFAFHYLTVFLLTISVNNSNNRLWRKWLRYQCFKLQQARIISSSSQVYSAWIVGLIKCLD